MRSLQDILKNNEDWLMGRVLYYAKKHGYTAYTSTLKEAWRLSIAGLSASIVQALDTFDEPPELNPEENLGSDPIARFGIVEARRHRARGVSLGMFLGLMKYYRQAYIDLARRQDLDADTPDDLELFIDRVFDRIEIGFSVEWSGGEEEAALHELQISNRRMTNEKNKYLTIFESIPTPVIISSPRFRVVGMNLAASNLFEENQVAGTRYYTSHQDTSFASGHAENRIHAAGEPLPDDGPAVADLLPWLKEELYRFIEDPQATREFEKTVKAGDRRVVYRVKLARNLDISDKFDSTIIILEDITSLKNALEEVKTLRGFVPICSHCKNIRNDQGFWQHVEQYVQDHSEATFSHGLCPDCAGDLYPEFDIQFVKK